MKHLQLTKHFNTREFDSPDLEFSGNSISRKLVNILQTMRYELAQPIIINSGFRSIKHNKVVNGVPNSDHLRGTAVDIKCDSLNYKYQIVQLALKLNIRKVGVYTNHVHLSIDLTGSSPVLWNEIM